MQTKEKWMQDRIMVPLIESGQKKKYSNVSSGKI
jgi:hypothetical protein